MMISNGTIGTSGGNHSFRGASTSRANQLHPIYISNAVRNTSASSVRDHLTSTGLADDIADIQLIPSRFNNDTSAFCVTLNSIAAEKRAHLAMKLTIDLVIATPHMPKNNCNTLRSCILKIDLSKTVNRDKYLKHLKRISRNNSMSNIDIYSCTDTSTAKRLVNTLSDQVIQCIDEACVCVSRETKSTAKQPSKRKPWWSKSTKMAKN